MKKWLSANVELSVLLLVSLVVFAGFASLQSSDNNELTGEVGFGEIDYFPVWETPASTPVKITDVKLYSTPTPTPTPPVKIPPISVPTINPIYHTEGTKVSMPGMLPTLTPTPLLQDSIKDKIKSGAEADVKLYSDIGKLSRDYGIKYLDGRFQATGSEKGKTAIKTLESSNADLNKNQISIWGEVFTFNNEGKLLKGGKVVGELTFRPTQTPTLTPRPALTPAIESREQVCISYGGLERNYFRGGYIKLLPSGEIRRDACLDAATLSEVFCVQGKYAGAEKYRCPYGCEKDACLSKPETPPHLTETPKIQTCIDSDGGINYAEKGNVNLMPSGLTSSDVCVDQTVLVEVSCLGGQASAVIPSGASRNIDATKYNCPYGCKNGACLPKPGATPPVRIFTSTPAPSIPEGSRTNVPTLSSERCVAPLSIPNKYVKSSVTLLPSGNIIWDRCLDASTLGKAGCHEGGKGAYIEKIPCDYGCKNDACLQKPTIIVSVPTIKTPTPTQSPQTCTDSDGGINYAEKGCPQFMPGGGVGGCDTCLSQTILEELSCPGGTASSVVRYGSKPVDSVKYNCPYGCRDGACLTKPGATPPVRISTGTRIETPTPRLTPIPPVKIATPTPTFTPVQYVYTFPAEFKNVIALWGQTNHGSATSIRDMLAGSNVYVARPLTPPKNLQVTYKPGDMIPKEYLSYYAKNDPKNPLFANDPRVKYFAAQYYQAQKAKTLPPSVSLPSTAGPGKSLVMTAPKTGVSSLPPGYLASTAVPTQQLTGEVTGACCQSRFRRCFITPRSRCSWFSFYPGKTCSQACPNL